MKTSTKKYIATFILVSTILPKIVLAQKNLPVPFLSQVPDGKWVEPWANACEETSTAMIDFFYQGYANNTIDIQRAKKKILDIVYMEDIYFGWNKDTNAKQMADIINFYFPWEAFIVKNPTLTQLKHEIDVGHPIILPVQGRDLHNAYYKAELIDYHVIVISGYDDEKKEFITQDPATPNGLDYHYTYDTIMTAMHDFLPNDKTYKGTKLAVFTTPNLVKTKNSDTDKDGLTKIDEINYGTSLWSKDTDGDGYNDGQEVQNGYSPTVSETKLKSGDLIKTAHKPDVYVLENGKIRKISSMAIFNMHGWDETQIFVISDKFFEKYIIGDVIGYVKNLYSGIVPPNWAETTGSDSGS